MREGLQAKVFAVAASKPQVAAVLCKAIEQVGEGYAKAVAMSDTEAAVAVKSGKADYFIGCSEDGVSILAIAIAFLGKESCSTIATYAQEPNDLDVYAEINSGVIAFGFSEKQIANSLNLLIPALIEEGSEIMQGAL